GRSIAGIKDDLAGLQQEFDNVLNTHAFMGDVREFAHATNTFAGAALELQKWGSDNLSPFGNLSTVHFEKIAEDLNDLAFKEGPAAAKAFLDMERTWIANGRSGEEFNEIFGDVRETLKDVA